MNKRTTDSYFPFFGVPYHLILHKKNKKLGLGNLVGGAVGGLGLGLGGGGFGPSIFLVSSGIGEFCDGKTALEKNCDCSFNGIPIICRLEMEIIAVCHVYVTQSSLNVTRVMSSEREFRSGLSQFHCTNEVKQGHKVQKINCSPDYILER